MLRDYTFTEEKEIVAEMMQILAFWTFEGETNFSEFIHISNHKFGNLKMNIDSRKRKFEVKIAEEKRAKLAREMAREDNKDIYSSNIQDLDQLGELSDGDLPPIKALKKKEISKFNSSRRSESKDLGVPEISKKDEAEKSENQSYSSDQDPKLNISENDKRKVKSLNKPTSNNLVQTINILSEGISQTSSVYKGQFKFLEEERKKREEFKKEFAKLDPEVQEKIVMRMKGIMADKSFMRYKMIKDLSTNGDHSSFQKSIFGSAIKNQRALIH